MSKASIDQTKHVLKQAMAKLSEARERLKKAERFQKEEIAIVGMACRFPGAALDPERYWENILAGKDAVTKVPPERWDEDEWYDPDPSAPGKTYSRHGGFLDGIDRFDPTFFSIAPRDALSMDPQHRLLLEITWEALERAGIAATDLIGSNTGVFIGITANDYSYLTDAPGEEVLDAYSLTGRFSNFAAGRIAYCMGFEGPTMAVDTACSSSLVSTHLACTALRQGECDLAVAGGVNIILAPQGHVILSKAQMLSPTGRCRTFDAAADGIVRSEGCGVLILKRLSDALRDNDPIVAVIRGSVVNQDGTSGGLTVPNKQAQHALLREASKRTGIHPHKITYIEAHGTGTPLGDPIEIRALGSALCEDRSPENTLWVGSVKSNIGHAESASGVAGLIKAALAVQHRIIPPHLHLKKLNPHIDWKEFPIQVPTKAIAWEGEEHIAGVSSFGASGTNAHILLGDAPPRETPTNERDRTTHLLTLSARTPDALDQLAERMASYLEANPSLALGDIAYTMNAGRSHFAHRMALYAGDGASMAALLKAAAAGESPAGVVRGLAKARRRPRVAFLFTGQGSQYTGMGRGLYESEPLFREALDRCAAILDAHLDRPLLEVLFEGEDEGSDLHQTIYSQPALCAFEYALATLWIARGVTPDLVVGHSVGEYAAAIVAGVFSLEDGLKLIAARGRLMQALPRDGEMAAIAAEADRVEAALRGYEAEVSIAAYNGPRATVISGRRESVRAIAGRFEAEGIKVKALTVSHAFHSPLMEPMLDAFRAVAEGIVYRRPRIRVVSNLSGDVARERIAGADYWREHIRAPVRFAQGIQTLLDQKIEHFLEIGPHPVLIGMGMNGVPDADVHWHASVRRDRDDDLSMAECTARLYTAGVPIDWKGSDRAFHRTRVIAPTYPFQRKRYWPQTDKLHPSGARHMTGGIPEGHPLLGSRMHLPLSGDIRYLAHWSPSSPGFLEHHRLFDMVVVPGASHVSLLLLGAIDAFGAAACTLEDIVFLQALVIPDKGSREVQWIVRPGKGESADFQVISLKEDGDAANPDDWVEHSGGVIRTDRNGLHAKPPAPLDIEGIRAKANDEISGQEFYQVLWDAGYTLGSAFCWIGHVWGCGDEAIARMEVPELPDQLDDYQLYPGLVDSCFQVMAAFKKFQGGSFDSDDFLIPFNIRRILYYGKPRAGRELYCHAKFLKAEDSRESILGDLTLADETGRVIAEIQGFQARKVTKDALARGLQQDTSGWLYEIAWRPTPLERIERRDREPGTFLIFADRRGTGARLAARLKEEGQRPVMVFAKSGEDQGDTASGSELEGIETHHIDPADGDGFQTLLGDVLTDDAPALRCVYFFWGIDTPRPNGRPTTVVDGQRLSSGGLLHVVQALVLARSTPPGGIKIVTRAAQPVGERGRVFEPAQSTLWGLGRVISLEHPELGCVLIDLDRDADPEDTTALRGEADAEDGEGLLAYREGTRFAARLVPRRDAEREAAKGLEIPSSKAYRLMIPQRGVIDHLYLGEVARPAPEAHEVEIEVKAIGVNFRDVLGALDLYPGDPGPFGGECSGIVARVGAEVRGIKPGDAVVAAFGPKGCFGNYAVVPALYTVPKPETMGFAEAVTLPATAMTALYGLKHLARLKKGEHVLIHAAAGGVGMAAVQIAKAAGAIIYGTAGTPEKRALIESMGVHHTFNSRTLDFKDEIEALIGKRKIDVVLNSLGKEFIEKSLELLKPNGRFVEIGKADVWDDARVRAYPVPFTYFHFDLAAMARETPELTARLLHETFEGPEHLVPLPVQAFPITQTIEAFRYMAQARHVGKVVVTIGREDSANEGPFEPRADRTWLITGGLGALGRLVAKWLVDRGARHLVLMGRSAPGPQALATIEAMKEAGADVRVAQMDVADRDALRALVDEIQTSDAPLQGVLHAAGVLDDGVILQQNWSRFAKVMAPKLIGAWNLHQVTKDIPLDYFVLFSSASSLLGSPGQSNYAASNAFLDGLAHYRRGLGLGATSINWGPWADGGMAQGVGERTQAQWGQGGMGTIKPNLGLRILEDALGWRSVQLGVLPVNWSALLNQMAMGRIPPYLLEVAPSARAGGGAGAGTRSELIDDLESLAEDERLEALLAHLQGLAAKVLGLEDPSDVSPDQPLREMGLDSLMGVELRNAMSQAVGKTLPVTMVFDYPTLRDIATHLLNDVLTLGHRSENVIEVETSAPSTKADEPIAVIGLGCRFPGGATDPERYWALLRDEVDAVTEIPPSRWDADAYFDPDPDNPGTYYTKWGGFLGPVDGFDASFFGIAPREAMAMDPQQRLLLEVTWEALEHAGIAPDRLNGSPTGMFVGVATQDYGRRTMDSSRLDEIDAYSGTGNAFSVLAGRVSYLLGLQGPCFAVDTACSSSLVALHAACQALRNNECSLALAAGVNLMLSPELTIYFSRMKAMSPSGRCHTFDAKADGYVRGEGCGVVVLKPLSKAIEEGDDILGVIRATALNHDGRSNGLTAPNGRSQQMVIRSALKNAGIAPSAVDYLEAHGTGTALGDPIEMQAVGAVLCQGRPSDSPLKVGSVKTNIGHTEGAAGIASVIKVLLSLDHKTIPASLHYHEPSPHIPWDDLAVEVVTSTRPWTVEGKRRVAGVSSFGFSGTNAHVVLEEAPERPEETSTGKEMKDDVKRAVHVLPLSARNEAALKALAARYLEHVRARRPALSDLTYSAALTRTHFETRAALILQGADRLEDALKQLAGGKPSPAIVRAEHESTGKRPRIAFLFTGQGSQYIGMGGALYRSEPVFREALDRAAAALDPHLDEPLLSLIYPEEESPEVSARLDQTAHTQPALFAIEFALAALWSSWGVKPDVVMGHSVGEIAAAAFAGVLSLEDGARLIAARGRLMQDLPPGGRMVSLRLSEADARRAIGDASARVSIAAVNGPESVVISGEGSAIDRIVKSLESRGVKTKALTVSHAFHSPLMDDMLGDFEAVVRDLEFKAPSCRFISNVNGALVGDALLDPGYWTRHVREPVRFFEGVRTACSAVGATVFIEMGPDPVLLGMASQAIEDAEGCLWLPSLRKGQDDAQVIMKSLGAYYVHDGEIDWAGFHAHTGGRHLRLPTYPWQRSRYWIERPTGTGGAVGPSHRLLGSRFATLAHRPEESIWAQTLKPSVHPLLKEEADDDIARLSLAMCAELAVAAARESGLGRIETLHVELKERALIQGSSKPELQVVSTHEGVEGVSVQAFYRPSADRHWSLVARGEIEAHGPKAPEASWESARAHCMAVKNPEVFDPNAERLSAGGHPPRLRSLGTGGHEACAEVDLSAVEITRSAHTFIRLVEDVLAAEGASKAKKQRWAGECLESLSFFGAFESPVRLALRWVDEADGTRIVQAVAFNQESEVVGEIRDLRAIPVDDEAAPKKDADDPIADWFYRMIWINAPLPDHPEVSASGQWLILEDRQGVGKALKTKLEAFGRSVHGIPNGPRAMSMVESKLREPLDWEGIVHLWSLDDGARGLSVEALADARQSTYASLLDLVHLLDGRMSAPTLWIMTCGAQAFVQEGDRDDEIPGDISPIQAPIWGLGKGISLEHPRFWGAMIDLDPEAPIESLDAATATLFETPTDDHYLIRGGTRHAARLVPAPVPPTGVPPALRDDRTYLVTGGLGGLGLRIASWLVDRGAKHLLLTSRSGLPERSAWDRLEDPRIDAIRALEAKAAITIGKADVSDAKAMHALVEALDHPLGGVVHAAGIGSLEPLISEKRRSILADTLKAKVTGSWVLHEISVDAPVDFFILFSSVASVWGGQGQAYYAAANAFLDALAWMRRAHGKPALSINWGPWQDGGMNTEEAEKMLKAIGLQGMESAAALEAMERLLGAKATQRVVSPVDWSVFRPVYEARGHRKLLDAIDLGQEQEAGNAEFLHRLMSVSKNEARKQLRRMLVDEVSAVLGYEGSQRVSPNRGFMDMGLDSLMAVQLMNRLKTQLGRKLPTTLVYEQSSINALADYLLEEIIEHDGQKEAPADEDGAERAGAAAQSLSAAEEASEEREKSEEELEAELAKLMEDL